jgi:hypothetical protein
MAAFSIVGWDTPRNFPQIAFCRGSSLCADNRGEMAEWLKAHAWKACLLERVTWVRIPLSPPYFQQLRDSETRLKPSSLLCERHPHYFAVRLRHFVRHHIAVHVHGGAYVRMSH